MAKLHVSTSLHLPLDWMTLATVVYGSRGCIAAGTYVPYQVRTPQGVEFNRKGGPIERLFERFHSLPPTGNHRGKYLRPQNVGATFWATAINSDGLLVPHRIADVFKTGGQQCFEITVADGKKIVATADHRFFVGTDYAKLSDLRAGDRVWVHNNTRANPLPRSQEPIGNRVYLNVKHHPLAGVKRVRSRTSRTEEKYSTYEYHRVARARAVVEAAMNGLALDRYVDRLNMGQLEGLEFLSRDIDVHHKDEDRTHDVFDNLVALRGEEHDRLHSKERHRTLQYVAVPLEIVSIVPVGVRETYDISMTDPWHNYVAAGFVTHNSGKTTLAAVFAEEVTKVGQRFCAIDLKGDWYGLKSTADGKGDGIPVIIFGGEHQDVPLEDGAGAFIGETVAGLGQSCVLDLEHLSKGKQVRFLAAFFESLYDRNRDPLLLLLDEGQRYAPQRPFDPDQAKCLGAVEDIVKLGRKHGIGPVILTQRGSSLNKEVSELCDMLVAFRTPGPLDQDRVKDWLDANATKAQRDEVMGQLSGLPTGTAVFASGHPDLKIFGVYPVRRRETFDSSATPKVGQRRKEPKRLARPDLDELRTKMAAAIERQKADDPKELRHRILELERAIKAKPALIATKTERVEVPIFDKAAFDELKREVSEQITLALSNTKGALHVYMCKAMQKAGATTGLAGAPRPALQAPTRTPSTEPKPEHRSPAPSDGEVRLGRCERALLVAFAQRHPAPSSASQVAILSGYSLTSSGFQNALSALRKAALIEGYGSMAITSEGLAAAGEVPTMPTGMERVAFWQNKLGRCEAAILGVLAKAYPNPIDRSALAHMAGYSETSSGFQNALSTLRTLEFIEGKMGQPLQARQELFE
jgi:Intein splicing domain